VDCLHRYPYPGNVRELANLIEQLVVLTPGDQIDFDDLPGAVQRGGGEPYRLVPTDPENLKQIVQDVEQQVIASVLKTCGTLRSAARQLGINHSTLSRKIKRYGITDGALSHHGE